jgi:hypothetical protein
MRCLLFHTLEGGLPWRPQGLGGHGAHDGQRGRIESLPESDKNAYPQAAEAQAFNRWIGATVMSTNPDDIELSRSERRKLAPFVLRAITRQSLYRILGEGKICGSSLRSRGALLGIRLIDRASLDAYFKSFAPQCGERREGRVAA